MARVRSRIHGLGMLDGGARRVHPVGRGVTMRDCDRLIEMLGLMPHPEGGHYRETFRDGGHGDGVVRGQSTAIFFLLKAGEISRWHRIDAAEIWHFYRGAPLALSIGRQTHLLGADIEKGEMPQLVVPPHSWQAARSLGDYTLVGCTVAPGFDFAHFELASDDFSP